MKRIYFILAGISLILFMSCARSEKGTKDTQTVKIDTVVSASSQTALQFPGKVKAAQDISLAFRVSGTIRKIYVEDGARVREGQLLAELDPADYRGATGCYGGRIQADQGGSRTCHGSL